MNKAPSTLMPRRARVLVAAMMLPAAATFAGSLTPPPGPPQPTMKALDQISPARCISSLPHSITEPGRYELCGDLVAQGGEPGIFILASGVDLDLGGFTLSGTPESGTAVVVSGDVRDVTIRNGNIVGWTGGGIDASAVTGGGSIYCWGVAVRSCGGNGITLKSGEVRDVRVDSCGGAGISIMPAVAGDASSPISISDVTVTGNVGSGIQAEVLSSVQWPFRLESVTSLKNREHGIDYLDDDDDGDAIPTLISCTTGGNTLSGVNIVNSAVSLDRCESSGNGLHGFHVNIPPNTRRAQNHNSSRSNRTSGIANGGTGFLLEAGAGVLATLVCLDSDFSDNGQDGVRASNASLTFEHCRTSRNTGDGVVLAGVAGGGPYYCGKTDHFAVDNGGDGWVLDCDDTDVDVRPFGCVYARNGGAGIRISVAGPAGSLGGTLSEVRCENNGAEGISISCPRADLRFVGGSTSGNTGDGVALAAPGTGGGMGKATFDRFSSSSNGGNGVAVDGSFSVSLDRCEMSANTLAGIGIVAPDMIAAAGGGIVHRDIAARNCIVSGNGDHGFSFGLVPTGITGPAPFSQIDVDSTVCVANNGDGIHVDARVGDATMPSSVSITDSSCLNNAHCGARVFAEVCVARAVAATSNGEQGLRLRCPSISVSDSTLARNGGGQLWCWGSGSVRRCDVGPGDGDGIHIAEGAFEIRDNLVVGNRSTAGDGSVVGVRCPDGSCVVRDNAFLDNETATSLADDTSPLYEETGIRGTNPLYTGN